MPDEGGVSIAREALLIGFCGRICIISLRIRFLFLDMLKE
jgi:hypothetical protein